MPKKPEASPTESTTSGSPEAEGDARKAEAAPKADVAGGEAALQAAKQAAEAAKTAAEAAPNDTALAKKAEDAAQVALAISSLVEAPKELTDEELIALAVQERKIRAGLGVVASITGALYALHQVLTDTTFQDLLNKDVPPAVHGAMTKALSTVLAKLDPLFSAFRKFQDPTLRDKTDNMFDAGVGIAYALVDLSEPDAQEQARKSADNIALVMGLIKRGGPLVLACIDLIKCCTSALGDNKASTPSEVTKGIGDQLDKALRARTAKREAQRAKDVEAGEKLLAAQKGLLLAAG
jgi:hypothetical protein